MDPVQITYDEEREALQELLRLRDRARRNPYSREVPAEARAWLRYGALPGELSAGTDFEQSAPGLREPGGSLNAALHQVQQQLKRSVKDFVENPSAALGLGARRMDEDTRYALETDPSSVLGFVPPAARFIQVPRLRLRANRTLPAPVRKAAGGSIAGTAQRMLRRSLPAWVEGWAATPAPRGALYLLMQEILRGK